MQTCLTREDFDREGSAIRQRMVATVLRQETHVTPFVRSMWITQSTMTSIMLTVNGLSTNKNAHAKESATKVMKEDLKSQETPSNDTTNNNLKSQDVIEAKEIPNDITDNNQCKLQASDIQTISGKNCFGKIFNDGIEAARKYWGKLSKTQQFAIKSALITAAICATETIIKAVISGNFSQDDLTHHLKLIIRDSTISAGIGYLMGLLTNTCLPAFRNLIEPNSDTFKFLLESIGMEMTECCINRLCSTILGIAFGSIFDIFIWIGTSVFNGQRRDVKSMLIDFVEMLAKSILENALKSCLMTAVSYAFTWWVTILISLVLGLFLDDLVQQATDTSRNVFKALFDGIKAIPYTIVSVLTMPSQNRDLPQALTCCVDGTLLDDPVYVQGQFMSRTTANRHVSQRLRGPSGDPVEQRHIKECPDMNALVSHYRKLYR